jgi:hypothetical protein
MPKRGKDKKKKKKPKALASSSGGELNLLVGKQGLNVPRASSNAPEERHQHSPHHSVSRSLNPDGNDLNPDLDTLNLASSDEAAWQFFGEGLLQSDEEEPTLGHPSLQTGSASIYTNRRPSF